MNKLYEEIAECEPDQSWNCKSEVYSQTSYPKNEFLNSLEEEEEKACSSDSTNQEGTSFDERDFNLDQTVKTWSDFNRMYYHPKSVNAISEFRLDNEIFPFDVFTYGKNAFVKDENEENSFEENFRFFAEECDTIQASLIGLGFQVTADVIDGFGGFACGFLERLREEYPKSTILSFGITEAQKLAPPGQGGYMKQTFNSSLSVVQLSEMSSLFIPLSTSPPYRPMPRFIQPNNFPMTYGQSIVVRGIPGDKSKKFFDFKPNLFQQLQFARNGSDHFYATGLAYPIPNSFPNIFMNLNSDGYVDSSRTVSTCKVKSVPVLTNVTVSTRTHALLQDYVNSLQKANFDLLPEFKDGTNGMSRDDFVETKEALHALCEAYENDQSMP
ncbi:16644_t:CDS:2 [Acaulospora colombiana]|uniref:16644_t:CDS:1 n=1 Tax=Acaulospora colombiana TaxID=27376 RepID=A0ACA9JXS1_9GLOM|nr:16644_t:CDS:2 [Acaulospora colombiana]